MLIRQTKSCQNKGTLKFDYKFIYHEIVFYFVKSIRSKLDSIIYLWMHLCFSIIKLSLTNINRCFTHFYIYVNLISKSSWRIIVFKVSWRKKIVKSVIIQHKVNKSKAKVSTHYWIIGVHSANICWDIFGAYNFLNFFQNRFNFYQNVLNCFCLHIKLPKFLLLCNHQDLWHILHHLF